MSFAPGTFAALASVSVLECRTNRLAVLPTGMLAGVPVVGTLLLTDEALLTDRESVAADVFASQTGLSRLETDLGPLASLPVPFAAVGPVSSMVLRSSTLSSLPTGALTGSPCCFNSLTLPNTLTSVASGAIPSSVNTLSGGPWTCSAGYVQYVQSFSPPVCRPCGVGYSCAGGAGSETACSSAAAGNYCPNGGSNAAGTACPVGSYCGGGTAAPVSSRARLCAFVLPWYFRFLVLLR